MAAGKGGWSVADFLAQCTEEEIPKFLKEACIILERVFCSPEETEAEAPLENGAADAA